MGTQLPPKPDCTAEYYPSQGGEMSASSMGYEAAGSPGDKEGNPPFPASMASDDGNHDHAMLDHLAQQKGLPSVNPTPENFAGGELIAGPNGAAEGDIGIQEYPRKPLPPKRGAAIGPQYE